MVYLPKKMDLSRCLLLSSVSKLAPKVIIHQSIFGGERRKFLPIIAGDPTAACSKPHCAVSVLIHAPNTVRPQSIKRTVMLPGSFFEGSNAKVDVRERLTVFSV